MTKIKIGANLVVGLALVGVGVYLRVTGSDIIENSRAIIGLSLIPLGIALYLWLSLVLTKKYPKNMNQIHIMETDERLRAISHRADSTTFRILRWALMLLYYGYTFLTPDDIFESLAWWIVLGFFMLSYLLQGILVKVYSDRETVGAEEEGE
jgi:hypothetical protein